LTINLSTYRHLSFDLWLTLIKSNKDFKHKRDLLFKDFFELTNPTDEISSVVRKFDLFCNSANEITGLNIDTFEIYLLILNDLKADISKINLSKLQLFYDEAEKLFFDYPPVIIDLELISSIEKFRDEGKTSNILSNTGFIKGETLRKLMRLLSMEHLFDFQIYSDECRFSKPNPRIFELMIDHVNSFEQMDKQAICHIGDNYQADFIGAKSLGISAFHLIR
jgi:putative hydrolase of the HAD superfamily